MKDNKENTPEEETSIFPTLLVLAIVATIVLGTMHSAGFIFDDFLIGILIGIAVLILMYAFLMKVLLDIKNLLKKNN